MNIKEAGRYSNHLQSLIGGVQSLITNSNNYLKVSELHLRSKANPDAQDETIETPVERIFTCQVSDLAHLVDKLIKEKLLLAIAIDNAKPALAIEWTEAGLQLTLDAAIEYNKKQRALAEMYLQRLVNEKPRKTITRTYGQKFNVEGNQINYTYDVEKNIALDYDKDVIKNLHRGILEKTDKISTLIEDAQLKDAVSFEPAYSIHDSLEDIIAVHEASLSK